LDVRAVRVRVVAAGFDAVVHRSSARAHRGRRAIFGVVERLREGLRDLCARGSRRASGGPESRTRNTSSAHLTRGAPAAIRSRTVTSREPQSERERVSHTRSGATLMPSTRATRQTRSMGTFIRSGADYRRNPS
jgi:hypothetical protein